MKKIERILGKGSHHKKKTEKFGENSLVGGGGLKFFSKKSQFQFGNFENPGGVSIFQNCSSLYKKWFVRSQASGTAVRSIIYNVPVQSGTLSFYFKPKD